MKKIVLALLSTVLASSFAYAAPHEKGAYIEGNIGTLYTDVNIFGQHFSDFGGVGLNANLGYLFTRFIGTEVGYTRYMRNGNSLNSADLALKAILPFNVGNQDLSVFAKAGPSYVFESGQGEWKPFLGVGAAYQVTPKLDLNAQVQGIHADMVNISLLSVGLTYHFDM